VKKLIILFALVFTAVCALGSDNKDKPKEKKSAVDAGSFSIYLNGKRIGTEKFHIEQEATEGVLSAEITVEDGANKSEQSSELRVGSDGTLKVYKWRSTLPTREESVVEPKEQLLIEHVTTAEQRKRDVPYILPLSTIILDDNFFSQRELLLWLYLQTGCIVQEGDRKCGPSHFGILVPHQHTAGSSVVELVGRDKINFKGTEKELNKFKVDTDGVQWLIWMDDPENHYKVLKMAIPSSNVEVWRD
jgi:hypothetical protein